MRIAVVGGTGTLGRRVAAALSRAGHEIRVLSRSAAEYPVDLTTGAGLDAALAGCEVVIDASNGPPLRRARRVLVDGSRRLLEVEAKSGVRHHVCVSIVGIDEVPMAYYRVKLEQERIIENGAVAWTIVRSTQFHDLLFALLSAGGSRHLLPVARAQFQPVDANEAAHAVAALAVDSARLARVTVAGPEVHDLRSLARIWRQATGRRALEIPVPLPGKLGRALREGRLTSASPDVRGTQTFAAWLQAYASG
ncbi:MAG: SDR family oxidoreductase [Solirubrobacteraceae bacterium]